MTSGQRHNALWMDARQWRVTASNEFLKKEVETLQTLPQRLQVSLLTGEQLHFYTGLQAELFQLLLTWLKLMSTELQLQEKHAPQVRILTRRNFCWCSCAFVATYFKKITSIKVQCPESSINGFCYLLITCVV